MTRQKNSIIKDNPTEINPITNKYKWLILAGIAIITLLVYSPIFKDNFLNYDDNIYITNNHDIHSLNFNNLKTFFTKTYDGQYLPLTMTSFAVDYKIGGLNPRIFVFNNLLIHILNSFLVFGLAMLLIKSLKSAKNDLIQKGYNPILISSISAILFSIHPVNVESVAWIAERKSVLYVFFFLLSIIFYIKYLKEEKYRFYNISLLLFMFSLLSKGVAVSLPLSIIALDYLFSRKLLSKKVIIEKIPFFIFSFIFGIITLNGQGKEIVRIDNSFINHLAFASYGFVNYVFKLILPINLSAYYFCPNKATLLQWFCFVFLLIIFLLAMRYRKRISLSRFSVFAFCFYLANIVFLIQLIPLGNVLMADRYIYVSSISFFLLVAMFVVQLAGKFKMIYLLLGISIIFYGFTAHQRLKVWRNSMAFWNDLIEKNDHLPFAWFTRGLYKEEIGDMEGALNDFNAAIQIHPNYKEAYYEMSHVSLNKGKKQLALDYVAKAIHLDPEYQEAYVLRSSIKKENGDYAGAIDDLSKAILIKPDYAFAYFNRGNIYGEKGDLKSALADYDKTINISPDFVNAYINRGNAKLGLGDYQGANLDYNKAIILNPELKEAFNGRGIACVFLEKYPEALADFNKAIILDPKYADAYYNRGKLFKIMKKFPEALPDLDKAIQLNPENMKIYLIRAKVNLKLKKYDSVISDCNIILNKNKTIINAEITRAAAYYLKGSYDEALQDLETVISQKPDIGAAYYLRGMTNIKLGKKLKGESDLVYAKKLGFISSGSDYELDTK
jgi:protein O-mannosyl-transferase